MAPKKKKDAVLDAAPPSKVPQPTKELLVAQAEKYLSLQADAKKLDACTKVLKTDITDAVKVLGDKSVNGSYVFNAETVTCELRHVTKTGTSINQERAYDMLAGKMKKDRNILTDGAELTFGEDKMVRLLEQGRITKEELLSVTDSKESCYDALYVTEKKGQQQ
jgi:propanediol dehydratase small subunit